LKNTFLKKAKSTNGLTDQPFPSPIIAVTQNIRRETAKSIKDIQAHLRASSDTLKIKGVYKEPKANYLSRLSDTWITTLLVLNFSAYGLMFYIGRWTVETEKKSAPASVSPTFPISNDKTGHQTDTTKKTAGH
jgi:hypothetical protein